jgi:DNA-binding transcriptional ArsR family regulator
MTRKLRPPVPIYSALADATRCRIVEILVGGPIPVHRLAEAFPISRPAISRHLRVLKTAGLVAEVKKGRENLYALRAERLAKAMVWLDLLSSTPEARPKAKSASVEIALGEKPARSAKQKPADPLNQMGFDF